MSLRGLQHRRCPGCRALQVVPASGRAWAGASLGCRNHTGPGNAPQHCCVPRTLQWHPQELLGRELERADTACGFVSPPSFLPRTLKSSTCGLGTASAAQGKRLPVAPAGLGTSVLASKTWTVMCLKEYHFLGLQTCESQGSICLYLQHQILTPDQST